jgi:magnesium transporter
MPRTEIELSRGAQKFRWLDLAHPTDAELDALEAEFNFHPLTIEDCKHFNQRAKVEEYEGYFFISLTTATRVAGEIAAQEIEVFLAKDYLVTVHREPLDVLEQVRERFEKEADSFKRGADFMLYLIADLMADKYFPLLDDVDDETDLLEDQIVENARRATLARIFQLKQQLILLRKITGPMREVMNTLVQIRHPALDVHTTPYFRNVYDHLTRIYDLIETSRDLLGNALDAYLSTVSNRLNEVMKRMTLIATIFMPISFLAGFGGMNFQQMPFDKPIAFAALLGLLVVVPTGMLIWFWRSKWV